MRLINADTYKTNIMSWKMDCIGHDDYESASVIDDCMCELDAMPTVDAAPVVHGRWEPEWIPTGVEYTGWAEMTVQALRCSVCGKLVDVSEEYFAYCPNCGAKMGGGTK